jgi:hypothetical protein
MEVALIAYGIITALGLFLGAIYTGLCVSEYDWFDADTRKGARLTLLAPFWPLAVLALPVLLVVLAVGTDPRKAIQNRAEKRRLKELEAKQARKKRIKELELDCGLELSE